MNEKLQIHLHNEGVVACMYNNTGGGNCALAAVCNCAYNKVRNLKSEVE